MSKTDGESRRTGGGAGLQIKPATIRELADILSDTGLTEIEVEQGSLRVRVAKTPAQQIVNAAPMAGPTGPTGSGPNPGANHSLAAATVESAPPPETPAPRGSADPIAHPGAVASPMVGTAYLSPEPGADAFVKVGQSVRQGETLLLIEAMKTFNPIKAQNSGTVKEIFVSDGTPVEYGQALLVVA